MEPLVHSAGLTPSDFVSDVLSIELPNKPAKPDQDCVYHALLDGADFYAKK
jgi:hypothetical protein